MYNVRHTQCRLVLSWYTTNARVRGALLMHYEQSSSLSVFIPCTADRCGAHSCVARYVTTAKADTLGRINESLVTAIPLVRFRVSIPGHCLDAPDRYPLPDLRWWIVAGASAAPIRLTAPASHRFHIAD